MSCDPRDIGGLLAEQQAAAQHIGSHARLLAGPGTGKTLTIVERVAGLIGSGIPMEEILCITFTRAAAAGLRRKLRERLGHEEIPLVYTLHSFALRQLMSSGLDIGSGSQARVADDWEERNVVVEDLKKLLGTNVKDINRRLAALAANWEMGAGEGGNGETGDPEFIGALREHKTRYRYVLRAELVYRLKEALDQDPFFPLIGDQRHVIVDEYQDLNTCDISVIDSLARRGAELFVAGDDDQSIYQVLRHGNPEGIRGFVDKHSAADLRLETCVRCDRSILTLATDVIRQEVGRTPKTVAPHQDAGDGRVNLLAFRTGSEEAAGIARVVATLVSSGVPADGMLVLLRSDHRGIYSGPLRDAMLNLGVPAEVRSSDRTATDVGPGRWVLGILRLLISDSDSLAWRSVLQLPWSGVGEGTIDGLNSLARNADATFAEALDLTEADPSIVVQGARARSAIVETRGALNALRSELAGEFDSYEAVRRVIELAFDRLGQSETVDLAKGELLGLVTLLNPSSLDDFLNQLAVRRDEEEQDVLPGVVNIMTMHKAKGLDACVVIVAAAEDELIPGSSMRDEERRLLYVSLTRARHALIISYAGEREGQQIYTGARAGIPDRRLTTLLEGLGLIASPGVEFAEALPGITWQ